MTGMSNEQMLAQLDAAYKNITDISDFGDAILQPAKFARFIREAQHRRVILPAARFIRMESQQVDIDRTGFMGRILRSGSGSDGSSRTLISSDYAKPSTATNKLVAQELQAIVSIRDRALRRNIERGSYENTLIDMFGDAAGRDLEEYALLADTNIPYADDDVLSKTDGWFKLAANKIYGRDVTGQVGADFDATDEHYVVDMFQAMLEALPKQFLQDPSAWRFYVDWDVADAYRNYLQSRETGLGDVAITGAGELVFKGIPVRYTPLLGRSAAVDLDDDAIVARDRVEGSLAMLVHPDNLAWGVFHEVTIEREREAKERRTDFVLTIEADAHFEDENAVVAAFIDKANPEADD